MDIDLKEKLHSDDDYDSENDDDMMNYFKQNKEAEQRRKNNITQALSNAQQDHDFSVMNPNSSRLDQTVQTNENATDTPAEAPTITEDPEGENAEGDENEDGADTPSTSTTQVPEMPSYDPSAMDDIAPAKRLRINQAHHQKKLEERQRMIEEMIAAEKEKDPDALDEDIIGKVNNAVRQKLMENDETNMSITQDKRKSQGPAVALTTIMGAKMMNMISEKDDQWKNQDFITKQKTTRVPGGPPKGPPPTGGARKPGAPPKGPPPTGGAKAAA